MSSRCGPEIPVDIWQEIAGYLPERRVCELYALNSTCFNIALNLKYRRVTLFKYSKPLARAKAYLQHLSQPHIAHRIRHFQISGFTLNEFYSANLKSNSTTYRIVTRIPCGLGSLIESRIRRKDIFELAHRLVAASHHAISLEIHGISLEYLVYWEFLRRIWTVMAPRLCNVSIIANVDELAFLVSQYSEAPCLSDLKWELHDRQSDWGGSYWNSQDQALSIVQKFTDGCATHLRSLSLIDRSQSQLDQAKHLLLFDTFFRLANNITTFSLRTNMWLNDRGPVERIVCRAKNRLVTLGIPTYGKNIFEEGKTESKDGHHRPLLLIVEHLTIYSPHLPDDLSTLSTAESYLNAMSVASSLNLWERPLELSDMENFLWRISTKPSVQYLQSISLSIDMMHPRLFEKLASLLPRLRHLALRHASYGFDEEEDVRYERDSCKCMSCYGLVRTRFGQRINGLNPLNWGLKNLEIWAGNPGYYSSHAAQLPMSEAFYRFIPSLSFVTFPSPS